MYTLGFRCSTSEFSYVILGGSKSKCVLHHQDRIKYPSGYTRSELLKWFYHEIDEILKRHQIVAIGVKGTEPMAMKGSAYGERMELEAMIFFKAAEAGINTIKRKVNVTIARDLGLNGRNQIATYDYSNIKDYATLSQSLQEAVQVGLTMLD
jgi:hypothetical protein